MIFVLDKYEKMVGVLNNDTPFSCPYFDDVHDENIQTGEHTYTFSVPANHEGAEVLEESGYVVIRDLDSKFQMFKIIEIEENTTDSDNVKTITSEHIAVPELLGNIVRPATYNGRTIEQAVSLVLQNTGWNIGEVDFEGTKDVVFDDYITAKEALIQVVTLFEAEVQYEIVFENGEIKDRLVHVTKQRGTVTDVRFEYGVNLQDVTRTTNSENIVTALIGVGQGDTDGNRLTLVGYDPTTDTQYGKDEQGLPDGFEKPASADYVGSLDALQIYGKDGKHIFGVYQDDSSTNQASLYQNTLAELKKRIQPEVTYTMKVATLERITGYEFEKVRVGDTIIVSDDTFKPRLLVEARVIELKRSYTAPENDEVTLGNYHELEVITLSSIEKIQAKITANEQKWANGGLDEAQVNAIVGEQVEPIKTDVSTVKSDVSTVQSDVADVKVDVQTVKSDVADVKSTVAVYDDNFNQINQQLADKEYKILRQDTEPEGQYIVGALWIDGTGAIHRYNGTEWELISVSASDYQAKMQSLDAEISAKVDATQYTNQINQLTSDLADKVDAEFVNGQLIAKADADSVYTKQEVDDSLADKADASQVYTKTEVDNALNSKVSTTQYTTDMNGVISDIQDHESRISQTESEITQKVSTSTYNQKMTALDSTIAGKADNSTVSALETRIGNAETSIEENSNSISLKANASDVYTKSQVDTSLAGKADSSDVTALEQRVSNTESSLTVQANQIASKVSSTEYSQKVSDLEDSISDKADASNVYSKTDVDGKLSTKADTSTVSALETRVSNAETSITQTNNAIALKANSSDVYTKSQVDSSIKAIQVGGKNLVLNSTFKNGTSQWSKVSGYFSVIDPESDKPNSYILKGSVTGLTSNGYTSAYSNHFSANAGDTFTFSLDFKVTDFSLYADMPYPFIAEFYDSTGNRVQYQDVSISLLGLSSLDNNKWYRVSYTITVTKSSVTSGGIRLCIFKNGEVSYREIKVEKGNKATDYTEAPEDVQGQIDTVEQRVTNTESSLEVQANQIASKVSTTTYESGIADAKSYTDSQVSTKADASKVTALESRMTTAESSITQLNNSITLKANSSDVYTKSQVDSSLSSKASQSALNTTNSNVSALTTRMTNAEASLTVQSGLIAGKVSQTDFDNLTIGARNLLLGTKDSKKVTGTGGTNQCTTIYYLSSDYTSLGIAGKDVTVSFDVIATTSSGTVTVQWNNTPWGTFSAFTPSTTSKHIVITKTQPSSGSATGIQLRLDNLTGDVNVSNFKMEFGNKATTWTPAPEDIDSEIGSLTTRVSTAESSITQQANQIASKVSTTTYNADINGLKTRMSTAESSITQNANNIASKVSTTDYNGNTIASLINQSATTIKLSASKIDLSGYVTVSALGTAGATTINGANIKTGTINAINITGSTITGSTFETTGTAGKVHIDSSGWYVKDTSDKIRIGIATKSQSWTQGSPSMIWFLDSSEKQVANVGLDTSNQMQIGTGYDMTIGSESGTVSLSAYDGVDVNGVMLATYSGTKLLAELNANNNAISHVNYLTFNDAGGHEGLKWYSQSDSSAITWEVFSSPDDGSNTDGALQFWYQGARQQTFGTTGNIYFTGHTMMGQNTGNVYYTSQGTSCFKAEGGAELWQGSDSTGARTWSMDIYNRTYSSSSNVYITSNGTLGRSTSARKYKIDEQPITNDPKKILKLVPKTWYDKTAVEIYSDLLTREANGEVIDWENEDVPYLERSAGLIAEDVIDAGLPEYVIYGKRDETGNREVEGLQYDRLWTLLIPVVKEHEELMNSLIEQNQNLIAKVAELEDRLSKIEQA